MSKKINESDSDEHALSISENAYKDMLGRLQVELVRLQRHSIRLVPWTIVRADDKHLARLNVIQDVLSRLHYKHKNKRLIRPDSKFLFSFDASHLENGLLAP